MVLWYKTSVQNSSKLFFLLRLMFDSKEETPLAYQHVKHSCIMLLLHALSLLKKSFQEWENEPNSEKQERNEEYLPHYLDISRKKTLELQCCSLPSVVCVLETEHQDLPWETLCLSSLVLHKYALLQLNQGYFERHRPKPRKHEGLPINLPNKVPALPWPEILTTNALMYFNFKEKL